MQSRKEEMEEAKDPCILTHPGMFADDIEEHKRYEEALFQVSRAPPSPPPPPSLSLLAIFSPRLESR